MNNAFIYVFSVDDKNTMISNGYTMLKADEENNIYIFENSGTKYEELGVAFVLSNTLTF